MITEFYVARKALLLASVLISIAGTIEQAHASNALNVSPHRIVELRDLDLDQAIDIERLHRRITQAAREVCRTPGVLATLRRGRMHQCTRDTVAHAVATLNLSGLTAHHQRKLSMNAASSTSVRVR